VGEPRLAIQESEVEEPEKKRWRPVNADLFERMEDAFPGFTWEAVEAVKDGRVKRFVQFTNWPTTGASDNPPFRGDNVSIELLRSDQQHLLQRFIYVRL